MRKVCAPGEMFMNGVCTSIVIRHRRQGVAGSGRVGDFCSFNTDCLTASFTFHFKVFHSRSLLKAKKHMYVLRISVISLPWLFFIRSSKQ